MKFFTSQMLGFMQGAGVRRNMRMLRRFTAALVAMIVVYSVMFHYIMAAEGETSHSWITGFYWTLTVMSTLGFGDITFHSDLGRAFSILVMLSGVLFLLIVMPFTFIQFFYAPWLEAQQQLRAPRSVPAGTTGHVILTHYEPVTISLVNRLRDHGRPYFVVEPDLMRALELHDQGVSVVTGARDDVNLYRLLRAEHAAMVVASGDDYMNTNIAFTVRELTATVPVVAFARAPQSVDVLELAGAAHVLRLTDMLGRSLARRALAGDVRASVIGTFGELIIAEAPVLGTPIVGRTVGEGWLKEMTGLTIVGAWERGTFTVPGPDTVIQANMVLVLAGSEEQLVRFEELTAIYLPADAPVLILGGGRVGRTVADELKQRGIEYRIVEKDTSRVRDPETYVTGDASDLDTLQTAGIQRAPAAIITTSDDATNIYLTIYCRRLRPDMQIISRSTLDVNVSTLHRAGADFVMSYASMGANAVFNILEKDDIVMVAEGLDVFRITIPPGLVGKTLASSNIRETTGVSVIAVADHGNVEINPDVNSPLPGPPAELILVGTTENERSFVSRYSKP